jgi:hypothetical protein
MTCKQFRRDRSPSRAPEALMSAGGEKFQVFAMSRDSSEFFADRVTEPNQ